MRFPAMNSQPRRSVIVPELSGGLNLRDGITNIRDNQLSDSLNMWFKDGALRTRPGVSGFLRLQYSGDVHTGPLEVYKVIDGFNHKLIYIIDLDGLKIDFYWCYKASLEKLKSITIPDEKTYVCFGVEHSGDVYIYLSDYTVWKCEGGGTDKEWENISDTLYVPTIMTHCRPQNSTAGTFAENTNYENYNLLTNKYKIICSTVNPSIDAETQGMRFKLPQSIYKYQDGERVLVNGTTVTAVHTYVDANGNVKQCTHTVTVNAEGLEWKSEGKKQADGLCMWIRSRYNYVVFSTNTVLGDDNKIDIFKASKEDYIEDNLEITATYSQTAYEKNKVFKMTRATWFGGSSSGLDNGTRVFLCRNEKTAFKNLIQWSAANNPLYFPADNNAFVGESQQQVESFGKQGDKLVIFKENETWCTYYVQNTEISSSDLINQNIIDVQSQGVYFPLVLINGHIGCDCPNTVQLCRNRLVWLHSSGKVYSLVSESNNTERSIYEVSEMISEKLISEGKSNLQNATSADWQGYYMLSVKDKKYLMDYNSYGYTHCYSYTKTEDANINIPWYTWQVNLSGEKKYEILINVENECICCSKIKLSSGLQLVAFAIFRNGNAEDRIYDEQGFYKFEKIPNYAISKFFDFDAPNNYKNIHSLGFSFGYNNGDEINLSVITEDGTEEFSVILDNENGISKNMPQFMKSICYSPSIRSIVRMGIKFSCEGLMIIDGMNIIYRLTGRAR